MPFFTEKFSAGHVPMQAVPGGPTQDQAAFEQRLRSNLVALAAAVLAVSLALFTFQPEGASPLSWGLLVLAFLIVLPLGLVRRSAWLLLFACPVAILAAAVSSRPGSWTQPAIQAHPELMAAVLIAYVASAMLHSTRRPNAPKPGRAPLVTRLACLVALAPVPLAAALLLATPKTLAHFGPDAARARVLALAGGLAGLVAVFSLALYAPMRSQARRNLTRMVLLARTYKRQKVTLLVTEALVGLVFAILALTLDS